MRQLAFDLQIPVNETFNNFIINEKNTACIQYIKQIISGNQSDRIMIYGEKGVGKSHLLHAICNFIHEHNKNGIYLPCHLLLNYSPEILQNFYQNQIICIDNIELLAKKPTWELALFNLWNHLNTQNTILILSANAAPKEIGFQLPDLVSRLTQMTIFQLHPLTDEEKTLALKHYASSQGYALSDAVINYLFNHTQRDLNSLFNVLTRLNQASLESKKDLNIPLLKKILEN